MAAMLPQSGAASPLHAAAGTEPACLPAGQAVAASIRARSPASSAKSAARAESAMVAVRLAPTITSTCGPLASSQASTSRCGLTPWRSASLATAGCRRARSRAPCGGAAMPPSGLQGMNASPRVSAAARVPSPLGLPVRQRVLVLGAGDRGHGPRLVELRDRVFADPDEAHLACFAQAGKRADALGDRHLGIGPVVLQEVDPLDAEVAQGSLALPTQVLRAAVWNPGAAGAHVTGLGGHHHPRAHVCGKLRQGGTKQALVVAHVRFPAAVAVRGVDEGHALGYGMMDHLDRGCLVGARLRDGQWYAAETDGADRQAGVAKWTVAHAAQSSQTPAWTKASPSNLPAQRAVRRTGYVARPVPRRPPPPVSRGSSRSRIASPNMFRQ